MATAGAFRACRRFERGVGCALPLRSRGLRQEGRRFTDGIGKCQEVVRTRLVGS